MSSELIYAEMRRNQGDDERSLNTNNNLDIEV